MNKPNHSFTLLACTLTFLLFSCTEDKDVGTGPGPLQLSATLTAPADGAAVTDLVLISVDAVDEKGVAKVEFYVDAVKIGQDALAPYEYKWNTSWLENGSAHSIYAVAYDTDDNKFGTAPITCTIDTSLATPEAPVVMPPSSITDSSVTLIWSQNTDVDFAEYVVSWDTTADTSNPLGRARIRTVSDTVLEITNLLDNTLYRFRVHTADQFLHVSPTTIVEARTPNAPPPRPELLNLVRRAVRLTFQWSAADISDFAKYELAVSRDSVLDVGDSTLATITDVGTTQMSIPFSDTGLFTFFVVVYDTTGLSSSSIGVRSDSLSSDFALQFNGAQFATVPYFPQLDLQDQYTLEAWVNMTSAATYMRVIDKGPPSELSPFLQFSLICDPKIGADVCSGGSPGRYHSTTSVPLNEWHHVALTYNNGVIIYYLDGIATDTSLTGITATCSFNTPLSIGRRKLFNEFYFRGTIDDIRIWNVVRTPSEIAATFNVRLIGNEPGLVCYFDFDEGAGDVISSPVGGNGHLGRVSGPDSNDPTWVLSTAPISN